MIYRCILGIACLSGLAACVGADEVHVPSGVTYATTGSVNTPDSSSTTGGGTGTTAGAGPTSGTGAGTAGTTSTTSTTTGTTTGGNPNGSSDPNSGGTGTMTAPVPIGGVTLTARLDVRKCLDIIGGKTAAGSALDLFDCNGFAAAQTWQLVRGQVRASNNRCLDLPVAAAVDTPLVINPCDDSMPAQQQWTLEGGFLKSNAVSPAFCVALEYGSTANGAVPALATCAATNDAQHWSANDTNTVIGGFSITSLAATDHCLVVSADSSVACGPCTDASAAQWTLDGSAKGTLAMNNGNCMAIQGTTLAMGPCTGAVAQQFSVSAGHLRSPDGTQCVAAKPVLGQVKVVATLAPCDPSDLGQQWSLGGFGKP